MWVGARFLGAGLRHQARPDAEGSLADDGTAPEYERSRARQASPPDDRAGALRCLPVCLRACAARRGARA